MKVTRTDTVGEMRIEPDVDETIADGIRQAYLLGLEDGYYQCLVETGGRDVICLSKEPHND